MKILIINGYYTNSKGMEAFSEFQWAIKKVNHGFFSKTYELGIKFAKRIS